MLLWSLELGNMAGKDAPPIRYKAVIECGASFVEAAMFRSVGHEWAVVQVGRFPFRGDGFPRAKAISAAFTTAEEWLEGAERARLDIEATISLNEGQTDGK